MSDPRSWTAIVLAGGRSSRMGTDKLAVDIDGGSSLARVLRDLEHVPVIVVGPPVDAVDGRATPVVVREDPPFSGPAAAIGAALPLVHTPVVAVIAGDMPFAVSAAGRAVEQLPAGADACIPVDETGRRQYLCAAYRTDALRRAVSGQPTLDGASVRSLIADLSVVECAVPTDSLVDLDQPADIVRARQVAEGIADTGTSQPVEGN